MPQLRMMLRMMKVSRERQEAPCPPPDARSRGGTWIRGRAGTQNIAGDYRAANESCLYLVRLWNTKTWLARAPREGPTSLLSISPPPPQITPTWPSPAPLTPSPDADHSSRFNFDKLVEGPTFIMKFASLWWHLSVRVYKLFCWYCCCSSSLLCVACLVSFLAFVLSIVNFLWFCDSLKNCQTELTIKPRKGLTLINMKDF